MKSLLVNALQACVDDGLIIAYERDVVEGQHYFGICWPNHCKSCKGWGLHTSMRPLGPGEVEFDSQPCRDCTDSELRYIRQRCARCGERGLTDAGKGPCTYCHWNYDDGMPEF